MANTIKEPQPTETPAEKSDERNAWGKDQEKHRYYYDDAHGYEKYEPDTEDEDDSEDKNSR